MRAGTTRVLLVSEDFHPVYGGAAVRFRRYIPGLAARGIDVEVVTATPKASKVYLTPEARTWRTTKVGEWLAREEVEGVSVQRLRLPDRGRRARNRTFSRRLCERCLERTSRPDVVHLLSLNRAWVPALERLRARGIASVFTKTMVAEPPPNLARRLRQHWLHHSSLYHVDRVVVSSRVMKDNLAAWGDAVPIEVIPNGVDLKRFHPLRSADERSAIRSEWKVPEDAVVALFVGSSSPRKGVDLLLAAWAYMAANNHNLYLVLVGPRRAEVDPKLAGFQRKLQDLAAASRASERIRWVGSVENVEQHMRAADIFLFTSRREGWANVIPEAMASGLPVVTTPFTGFPDEFGIAGRHYVQVDFTPVMIADAVCKLAADPSIRDRLSTAARAWAELAIDVEQSLDRYAEVYHGLAHRIRTV